MYLQPRQLRVGSKILFSFAPAPGTTPPEVIEGTITDWSPSGKFVQLSLDLAHRYWNNVNKVFVHEVLRAEENDT